MAAAFDEMTGSDGAVRPAYRALAQWLAEVPPDVLDHRRREAELLFQRIGITFAVYGMAEAQERLIPRSTSFPALCGRPTSRYRAHPIARRRSDVYERVTRPKKPALQRGFTRDQRITANL